MRWRIGVCGHWMNRCGHRVDGCGHIISGRRRRSGHVDWFSHIPLNAHGTTVEGLAFAISAEKRM